MKEQKFKTTINCGGCVAKVTPFLDAETGIESWDIDTTTADKILTVKSDTVSQSRIMEIVTNAGFKITSVS
ncbi:heavy-metal-associated domain-containing protein [Flavobacterium rhizosphaerae]|uniref:Cation transporter n=1 Tax=Flavobacterium rhizosphaerae TaxID=3163298 RepID=A0ABW8YWA5_9FLAO